MWRVSIIVFLLLAGASVWAWRGQVAKDQREGTYARARVAKELVERARTMIGEEAGRAREVARMFQHGTIADQPAFTTAVQAQGSRVCSTWAWIGPEGVCEYAWSRGEE